MLGRVDSPKELKSGPLGAFIMGYEWSENTVTGVKYTPVPKWCTPVHFLDCKRTWSIGHRGPPYTEGGPFGMYHTVNPYGTLHHQGLHQHRRFTGSSWLDCYDGGFVLTDVEPKVVPALNPATMGSDCYVDFGDPTPYGPTAWNRYRPGKSVGDLAVMLAEIRDVPRTLQQSAKGFRDLWKSMRGSSGLTGKKLADHWLNTQFGWLPFLNDLRKLHRSWANCDRMMRQVRANNGRWVKRGGSVAENSTSSVIGGSSQWSAHNPAMTGYWYSSPTSTGSHTITQVESTRVWFEGAFRYWIPDVDSVKWERRFVAHLYGGVPNPALVWELTPWSWLIDWFSTVGDSISNLDNGWAQNMAAKYAYVMATTELSAVIESTHSLLTGALTASDEFKLTVKKRSQATPFGFGLSWGDLSPRQLSIMGALGLSRASWW